MSNLLTRSIIFAVSAALLAGIVFAAPALAALMPTEIENKITAAKILSPGDKILSLKIREEEVQISKNRTGQSSNPDKDCKIDAVLIGRVVMTADSGIKRVRVRFFETKDSARYSEVQVRAGDIKAFASGVMSQTDLLSSLEITRGTDTDMSTAGGGSSKTGGRVAETVVSGAQQEERAALLDRINTLGERGVNILGYKKQFTLLEETAKGGDKYATADALDKLTVSVKDQEKALAQKGQRTSPRVATAPAQSGQSAQPAQSAQPGESGSTGVGLPSKAVMLTVKNSKDPNYDVSKLLFGDFAPVTGPYQTERELITNAIMKKKQDGFNVRCYLQMVSDLNFYAKRKDLLTLGSQIRNAFGVLGITDDQLYKYRKLRRKIERNINAD